MMDKLNLSCDSSNQLSFEKFLIPNIFKKIGLILVLFSFVLLIVNKVAFDNEIYRLVIKYVLLLGMFLMAIAKEKIEDELIAKMRMQSFALAFITGVILSLAMPYIDYFVDVLLSRENPVIKENGDFLILWLLLSVKVLYFESLKKYYK